MTKRRHQYYTPVPQKFFGYSQMPRQQGLPYQNEQEYQKLLKRHIEKGQMLRTFDFPLKKGKEFEKKTDATEKTLSTYGVIASN